MTQPRTIFRLVGGPCTFCAVCEQPLSKGEAVQWFVAYTMPSEVRLAICHSKCFVQEEDNG